MFEWKAGTHWRSVDFVSDLHLSSQTPATAAAFERYLRQTEADALVLLGDVFEVWVGDDAADGAFEARFAACMSEWTRQRVAGFMAGNRDFLVGPAFLQRCGLQALPDPSVLAAFGQRVLLTHGDAWCLDDPAYQRFRAQVRAAAWQQQFLAQTIEQRRDQARQMRQASRQRQQQTMVHADVDPPTALSALREASATVLVHGHTHRPGSAPIDPPDGPWRHVLSDWDLDHPGLPRAEVLRLSAAGFERLALPLSLG